MNIKENLVKLMKDKTARIAILGLGYVGLPLAVVFAEAGFNVTGIDPDERKPDSVNKGVSYIPDIPTERLAPLVKSGKLKATADFSVLKDKDAASICVPTPQRQTGDPDMSFILSATEQLAMYMHKGMVVVLESSTYPGTTREILLPKLGDERGFKVGEDWFLAFSPERVDPGRQDFTTLNTPKVMGGITEACAEVAMAWYGGFPGSSFLRCRLLFCRRFLSGYFFFSRGLLRCFFLRSGLLRGFFSGWSLLCRYLLFRSGLLRCGFFGCRFLLGCRFLSGRFLGRGFLLGYCHDQLLSQ
jgi:hypothetical protein